MDIKRIKRITSHVGLSRYMRDLTPCGEIPRIREIPSPYAFSPTHKTYQHKVTFQVVFIVETAHKQYDVFSALGALAACSWGIGRVQS